MNKLPKPTITDKELNSYQLTHKIAGNGLYFIRHLGDDMCQTCWVHIGTGIGTVFLTATAMLAPFMVPEHAPTQDVPNPAKVPAKIDPAIKAHITKLRLKLKAGEAKIENQRVVVTQAA